MRWIFLVLLCLGCTTLPQLYQSVEKIADDEAIKIMVSQEAMQKKKDVSIIVNVKNLTN